MDVVKLEEKSQVLLEYINLRTYLTGSSWTPSLKTCPLILFYIGIPFASRASMNIRMGMLCGGPELTPVGITTYVKHIPSVEIACKYRGRTPVFSPMSDI